MSEEQFWKGDPYLAVVYRKLDLINKERNNEKLWLQGHYVYEAFVSVMSAAFGKKGAKPTPYPKEPHRITPYTEAELEEQKEKERQKAIRSLDAWKAAWDRKNAKHE